MRRLILMTLFVGLAVPAAAQKVMTPVQPGDPQASPDAVVARMMSFDRNHDGLVSREELPERMQPLLARIEVFTTGDGLDEKEIRRLAAEPIATPQVFVVQAGHYGFGDDEGFDTRLRIDSAIEDLRLASATHDQVLVVGHRFAEVTNVQARSELVAVMTPILAPEQMANVTALLDRPSQFMTPKSVESDPAQLFALRAAIATMERRVRQTQLSALVASFGLAPEQNAQVKAAVEQFKSHEQLTDADRTALLGQMQSLLSAQERDDLRAALERRPIVKRGGTVLE